MLTTMLRPSAGQVLVAGHDLARDPRAARQATGVVFQDSVLDNDFSGRQNLNLHARLWRLPRAEADRRIAALLAVIGLADRAGEGVRTYSGGMRRRLEIARALLAKPAILLLDEPTTGLDPAVRQELWDLIRRLRDTEGVTVLLSTHYLEEAERVCDRVAIMHRGRLVAVDTPRRLVDAVGHDLLELGVNANTDDALQLLQASGATAGRPMLAGQTISVPIRPGADQHSQLLRRIVADGLAASVTIRRGSLNDVFLHLTSGHPGGVARAADATQPVPEARRPA
jgi:ABC-2 type transport system ATP-binding protein